MWEELCLVLIIPTLMAVGTDLLKDGAKGAIKQAFINKQVPNPNETYGFVKKKFIEASRKGKIDQLRISHPGYDLSFQHVTGNKTNGLIYEFNFSDGSKYVNFREISVKNGKQQVQNSEKGDLNVVRARIINWLESGSA